MSARDKDLVTLLKENAEKSTDFGSSNPHPFHVDNNEQKIGQFKDVNSGESEDGYKALEGGNGETKCLRCGQTVSVAEVQQHMRDAHNMIDKYPEAPTFGVGVEHSQKAVPETAKSSGEYPKAEPFTGDVQTMSQPASKKETPERSEDRPQPASKNLSGQ